MGLDILRLSPAIQTRDWYIGKADPEWPHQFLNINELGHHLGALGHSHTSSD